MSTQINARITYTALIGHILMSYRQRANLPQLPFADKLGITQSAYSRIEKGGTAVTLVQLKAICRVLNVNPAQVVADVETWSDNLRQKGVTIIETHVELPKAELMIGLGMLAIALAAVASQA